MIGPRIRLVLAAVAATALLGIAVLTVAGGDPARADGRDMIVLGFDGMDYELTRRLMAEGRLPNLSRLAEEGDFGPLETSQTPQSPVAWSNFITGLDAGGHGIFDFLHRNPDSPLPFGEPYQATSRQVPFGRTIQLGKWVFPLSGGGIELARDGMPFWAPLQEAGVPATIIRIPANFPPSGLAHRELSGMGTPDLVGTSGTFTFFSTDRRQFTKRDVTGGQIFAADVVDGIFEGALYGPPHPLIDADPETEGIQAADELVSEFTVYIDADNPAAKLVVGDQEFVLAEGEWSGWKQVDFEVIPYLNTLYGAARFYLRSVRPEFELYVSPIQIDPMAPAMPISTPESFATELAEATGRYYTQEMPEDTKALQHGVFDLAEFVEQARMAGEENAEQYRHLLEGWDGGLLFYYFGNGDQVSHVLYGVTQDPEHPQYVPEEHDPYRDVIPRIYERYDEIVGYTLERVGPDTTVVAMSDHGFTSWRREFHLNTWLVERGYMELQPRTRLPVDDLYRGVDWRNTRAYALGISGLYLNLRGREGQGIVAPGDRMELLEEIERELLATVDPATGEPAVTKVYIRERDFHDRGNLEIGPDLIVGYAKGTRGSGEDALGGIAAEVIEDNTDDWSGDHIMDHRTVPGILAVSRSLERQATSLQNLAASILAEFGIEGFPDGSAPTSVATDDD
ncbi:MAG: alkaline phosphatase family protein [Acidobacteriota bacterium]